MIDIPVQDSVFGQSPKNTNPKNTAPTISRYCSGARVADGAKRSA
tara:strand:- start:118 stop:252 length:135 start_codon:yes stop_codon:yes gene_type:complete